MKVYLNGDGLGKSTHFSFFFAVIRGPYDDLLPWPFKQQVTLALLNQARKKETRYWALSARPTFQFVCSFQHPQVHEMNVVSGSPMFIRTEHLLSHHTYINLVPRPPPRLYLAAVEKRRLRLGGRPGYEVNVHSNSSYWLLIDTVIVILKHSSDSVLLSHRLRPSHSRNRPASAHEHRSAMNPRSLRFVYNYV